MTLRCCCRCCALPQRCRIQHCQRCSCGFELPRAADALPQLPQTLLQLTLRLPLQL